MKNLIYITLICLGIICCNSGNDSKSKKKPFKQNNIVNTGDCEIDKTIIKGTWISNEDNKYKLIISDKYCVDVYDGEDEEDAMKCSYYITNKIDANSNNCTCYLVKKETNSTLTFSYEIMSLSDKTLTLMYLERGNLLVFTRKDK